MQLMHEASPGTSQGTEARKERKNLRIIKTNGSKEETSAGDKFFS